MIPNVQTVGFCCVVGWYGRVGRSVSPLVSVYMPFASRLPRLLFYISSNGMGCNGMLCSRFGLCCCVMLCRAVLHPPKWLCPCTVRVVSGALFCWHRYVFDALYILGDCRYFCFQTIFGNEATLRSLATSYFVFAFMLDSRMRSHYLRVVKGKLNLNTIKANGLK